MRKNNEAAIRSILLDHLGFATCTSDCLKSVIGGFFIMVHTCMSHGKRESKLSNNVQIIKKIMWSFD